MSSQTDLTETVRLSTRIARALASDVAAACLGFLVLIVLATQPAAQALRTSVIGDPYSDLWKHMWGLWWFDDALRGHHALPLFTRDINFPQGGYLYFADPMTASLSVPLQPLLGLVCTYNVLIMAQLLGGCVGAYLLARQLGVRHPGAFLCGVVYGLSPYVLSYSVASGVTETVNLAWPPLYLVFLLRALRGDGFRAQATAGLFLFLTAYACWYYAEFLLLMTALCVVFDGSAQSATSFLRGLIDRARRAAPILLVGLGLILPFASTFFLVLKNPYNLVTPDKHEQPGAAPMERNEETRVDYLGESQLNYTGLVDFVLPGKANATTTWSMDRLTRVYYIGVIVIVLVAVGLALQPRPWGRDLRFWLCSTLFFAILSLGPVIHLRSSVGRGSSLCASWPYIAVYYSFPVFKQIGQPFRLMLLVYLGVGILAGFALQRLGERLSLFERTWWIVPVAVLLETLYASPTPFPMPLSPAQVHPIYHEIAREAGADAVWDLPGERPGSKLQPGEYYYYQTVHHHPIPYRTSGEVSPQIRGNNVHRIMARLLFEGWDADESRRLLPDGLKELAQMRVRWLVVHRDVLGVRRTRVLLDLLRPALGKPWVDDEELVAWRLYDTPPADAAAGAPQGPPPPPPPAGAPRPRRASPTPVEAPDAGPGRGGGGDLLLPSPGASRQEDSTAPPTEKRP